MASGLHGRRMLLRLASVTLVAAVLLALGEIGARVAIAPHKKQHPPANAERFLPHGFQYDARVGWLPTPGFDEPMPYPAATIQVSQNSEGFRESERDLGEERPEWAVLGDSQTWGYNVEAADRFSDLLDERFPGHRFRNYGVSGYGTAQELLVYRWWVHEHEPQGVLLLFGKNDRANNRKARTRGGYARPRFLVRDGELVLENPVVPNLDPLNTRIPWYRSHLLDALRFRWEEVLRKLRADPTDLLVEELARTLHDEGRAFAVVIEAEDPQLVALCERIGVPVIELGPILARAGEQQPVWFPPEEGGHWTPRGHRMVAEAIAPWLAPELR